MQVEALVEAPALDAGGLDAEAVLELLVHQREQLHHVALVRVPREHLAHHLDVPRAVLAVAVRHVACQKIRSVSVILTLQSITT